MKKLFYKISRWYRGYKPYSIEEMFELQRSRYLKEKKSVPYKFDPPFVAKALNSIGRFWLRNWKWLLGFMATLIGLFIGYLKL